MRSKFLFLVAVLFQISGALSHAEVVNVQDLARSQAKTLFEGIKNSGGVDGQVGCAACGLRRVMINGIKDGYTSVLTDEIPISSPLSNSNLYDLMTTAGVAKIEIERGVTESVFNPDSVVNTIHVVPINPTQNTSMYDFSLGSRDYRSLSILGTGVNSTNTRRALLAGQYHQFGLWDSNGDGLTESPARRSASLMTQITNEWSPQNRFEIRGSFLEGRSQGGSTEDSSFVIVQNPAKAGVSEITTTRRYELFERWTHRFLNGSIFTLSGGAATQIHDAFSRGYADSNQDKLGYGDLRYVFGAADSHQVTLGTNYKGDHFRSSQQKRDDYDQIQLGGYLQDRWSLSPIWTAIPSLRMDQLIVNWRGNTAKEYEIMQWAPSPRFHLQWGPTPLWTSRASWGLGYRAPLTVIESAQSQVGNSYPIQISKPERLQSVDYSLKFSPESWEFATSAHWSQIRNWAYLDRSVPAQTALVSDPGSQYVKSADLKILHHLSRFAAISVSYEKWFYDPGYKKLLPITPIEERVRGDFSTLWNGWGASLTPTWIGARKTLRKPASAFSVVDTKVWKTVGTTSSIQLYLGLKNLLNTVQVANESPWFTDSIGNLESTQIWGQLRGREFYAGIQGQF